MCELARKQRHVEAGLYGECRDIDGHEMAGEVSMARLRFGPRQLKILEGKMKVTIERITEGEESVLIRCRELTPSINRAVAILHDEKNKLWGRVDEQNICINRDEVLYLESVDEKVFAYTDGQVLRIDGTLNSFLLDTDDESFFRCSKSMVLNVNRVTSLKSLSSNRIDATMEGGEHIIISRRYASEFRKLLKGGRK